MKRYRLRHAIALPLIMVLGLLGWMLFPQRHVWLPTGALNVPVQVQAAPTLAQQVRNAEIQRLIARICWEMHRHRLHGNAGAWAECARHRAH